MTPKAPAESLQQTMVINPPDAADWRVGQEVRRAGLTWIVTRVDASGVTIVAGKGLPLDEEHEDDGESSPSN